MFSFHTPTVKFSFCLGTIIEAVQLGKGAIEGNGGCLLAKALDMFSDLQRSCTKVYLRFLRYF
jgi:hypothetical protein